MPTFMFSLTILSQPSRILKIEGNLVWEILVACSSKRFAYIPTKSPYLGLTCGLGPKPTLSFTIIMFNACVLFFLLCFLIFTMLADKICDDAAGVFQGYKEALCWSRFSQTHMLHVFGSVRFMGRRSFKQWL